MAMYLTSQDEPTQSRAPIVRGRGYQLTAGVNMDGWRPYVTIWRGERFVNEQGDPAYYAATSRNSECYVTSCCPPVFRYGSEDSDG